MSLEQTYQEMEFLLESKPQQSSLKIILFIHAINIHNGLKHNGLKEEDPNQEWQGIAEKWDQDDGGIYSLRYNNKDNQTIQFKLVTQPNSTWLSLNAVKLEDDSNLYSFQIDWSKQEFGHLATLCKSSWINEYLKNVIVPLMKKKAEQSQKKEEEVKIEKPAGIFWQKPRNDLSNPIQGYGRQDLDPFNNPFNAGGVQGGPGQFGGGRFGTGGNLFGPGQFNNQQFQPPGARFDPFGPDPEINGSFPQWEGQPNQRKPGFGFGSSSGFGGGFFQK